MPLNKEFFNRETNIKAKVIADSVSVDNHRITSFEIEFPRFILAEFLTHRELSRNTSSSRAIPVSKMLDSIENNIAMPTYWGVMQSGMQAENEVNSDEAWWYQERWKFAFDEMKYRTKQLSGLLGGKEHFMQPLHKQIANRLTEPFQMIKMVTTATNWDNFFNLRIHRDSQPEICMLAYKMYQALQDSKPTLLHEDEWHLPYFKTVRCNVEPTFKEVTMYKFISDNEYANNCLYNKDNAIKLSAANCASVSYRNEVLDSERADKIFDMLIKSDVIHASPFEHIVKPIVKSNVHEHALIVMDETVGITHINNDGTLCSGNLKGWISYRHLLPNNTCYEFDFEERMKSFE